MSKITRHNYEEFFIDYFDGSLNNHQVAELMLFLAQNKDLDEEFNQFKYIELKEDNISFNLKNDLKKEDISITGSLFHDRCIDKIENNLSSEQNIAFEKEIETDLFKKAEFVSFKNTILKPDINIVFDNKEELKREKSKVFKLKRIYQYAAIITAILISFTLLNNKTKFNDVSKKTPNYASVVNFDGLSSFDKYDNQQSFTIVKTETPGIVSKSSTTDKIKEETIRPVYINKIGAQEFIVEDKLFAKVVSAKVENSEKTLLASNNIDKELNKLEINNNIIDAIVNDSESDCNPNTIKTITNEIKSDVYISKMMMNYKNKSNQVSLENNSDSKTVWELLGEGISSLTGAKMEKSYDNDGEVSRLALNGERFRVSKKIRK